MAPGGAVCLEMQVSQWEDGSGAGKDPARWKKPGGSTQGHKGAFSTNVWSRKKEKGKARCAMLMGSRMEPQPGERGPGCCQGGAVAREDPAGSPAPSMAQMWEHPEAADGRPLASLEGKGAEAMVLQPATGKMSQERLYVEETLRQSWKISLDSAAE